MAWTHPKTWTDEEASGTALSWARGAGLLVITSAISWAVGAGYITLASLGLLVFGVWTTPKTWTAVVVTVADLNTHIRDNLNILKTSINDDGTVKTCVGKTTATVDYTNSTVHTGVGVFTVPGNTLGTGNVIRMTHDGFINATGSSRNLTVRVLWGNGGTIITAFSYVQSMTASTISAFRLECDVIAAGATNVQHIVTRYTLPVVGGTPGTTGAGGISSNTIMGAYQSASIDSTADQVLQVTYEWSAADANNHAYAHATTWEVLRTT